MAAFVSFTTGVASRSVTVPAGTDRLLVAIANSNASTGARTATYDGVAMSVAQTDNGWAQIFYMLNPAAGAATLAVSGANISSVIAAHYTGIGSFQSGQQGSVASASFSPNAGGAIIFGMVAGSVTHTPVADTNERQEGGDYYADRLVTTSGSVTVGVSSATDPDYAGAIFLDSVNVSGTPTAPVATSAGTASTGVSASGSLTAPVPSVSGSVSVIVDVSGNVTAPVATVSASATPFVPGVDVSAAVSAPVPTVSGSVSVIVDVSGNISAPAPTVSGSVDLVGSDNFHAGATFSLARGSAALSLPTLSLGTARARGAATEN